MCRYSPPLDDDEPVGAVRVPTVPPPTETPTVFQVSQQQAAPRAAPPAADNKVFAHSLKMAGIGRGRGVAPAAVDTQALTAGRGAVGRGVAVGGLQAGHTVREGLCIWRHKIVQIKINLPGKHWD